MEAALQAANAAVQGQECVLPTILPFFQGARPVLHDTKQRCRVVKSGGCALQAFCFGSLSPNQKLRCCRQSLQEG
jgi:hypothetical protein